MKNKLSKVCILVFGVEPFFVPMQTPWLWLQELIKFVTIQSVWLCETQTIASQQ